MNFHNPLKSKFSSILLRWNTNKNTRKMPWKGEKDPYKIWLSEIILQQTRVEQGLAYYQEFIKNFPDIHRLARAKEERVYKLWEGLGYYTRCRNLIETAKYISLVEGGQFPETYEKILSLKGIGAYTAAAISSFAYNLPYAVLDGNVYRVLSRVFGIKIPVDSIAAKKEFSGLATTLLDKKNPGVYNQALMDFGAVVCKPANPICKGCGFKKYCFAFQHNLVDSLPVKGTKKALKKRWFYYLVMEYEGRLAVKKRNEKDIWRNLYEFPLVETEKENTIKSVLKLAEKDMLIDKAYSVQTVSEILNQKLSHRHIIARFIKIRLKKPLRRSKLEWILPNKTSAYPFPKIINDYLAAKE